MDNECLSLTWNNHGATYRQTLNNLRKENTLTDITLACDGQKFSAHKLVLVTCSDYFRSILGDLPCQHPIVYMRGVTAQEMQALIDFMYTGQTSIPQKEVPTLLSTAEALQIKGLGVLNANENQDTGSRSQRECSHDNKRKRSDLSSVVNGMNEESSKSSASENLTREDKFLENLYSHHYAFLSSPKQRRIDDKTQAKIPEYISGSHTPCLENSPQKESSSSKGSVDPNSISLSPGILNNLSNLLHHQNPESSKSSLPRAASPMPQSPQDRLTNETIPLHTSDSTKDTPIEKDSRQSVGHPTQFNPRLEGKAVSPRALNYSIAGLGGNKDNFGTGLHSHPSEESSGGHGDTPENLIKTEVKEEALDFSNTTMPENHLSDSSSSTPKTNNIGEETRMYLDAFARSANLSWQQTAEDTVVEPSAGDGRPFVCPICNKCFAKAAILKRHHLAHFRPYVCHLCPRSFTRREVLAEHMLEHTGADLRMPCPVCGMTIKRKRNLQAHIKVKHPDYYLQKSAKKEATC